MNPTKAQRQTPSQKSAALADSQIKNGKTIPPPKFELGASNGSSQETNVFKMAVDLSTQLKGERALLDSEFQKLKDQNTVETLYLEWLREAGNKPREVTKTLAMLAALQNQGRVVLERTKAIDSRLEQLTSMDPGSLKKALQGELGDFASFSKSHNPSEAWSVNGLGGSKKSNVESRSVNKGQETLTKSSAKRSSFDLGTQSFGTADTQTMTFDKDGKRLTEARSRNGKVADLKNGMLNRTEADSSTLTEGSTVLSKEASGKSSGFGTKGYSSGQWKEKIKGGNLERQSSEFKVNRGGGQLGVGKSWKAASGTTGKNQTVPQKGDVFKKYDPNAMNKSGALDKGRELEGGVQGGAVFGPDAVGAFGNGEAGVTNHFGNGLNAGAKVGLSGKTLVTVNKVPGSNPPLYAIQVTVSIGGGLSLSAAKKFQNGTSVQGSLAQNSSSTTSYSKVLDEAAAREYLDALSASEKGKTSPKHPELAVISTGVNQGWEAAGKALAAQSGVDGSDVRKMAEGESYEDKDLDSSTANLGASYNGIGLNGGWGNDHSRYKGLRIVNGTPMVTVQVTDTERKSLGGSVGTGLVSGGLNVGNSQSNTHSISVALPFGTPDFDQVLAQIQSANSYADMVRLQKFHPGLTFNFGHGTTSSSNVDTTLNVGPLTAGIKDSASRSRMDNADGSTNFKGRNSLGGRVGLYGLNVGSSDTEELDAKVDARGNAQMDLHEVRKSADLSKSVDSAVDSLKNNTLAYLGERVTGSGQLIQEQQSIPGTLMTNREVGALIHLARNANAWGNVVSSPRLRRDWMPLRVAIRNAGGDRKRIAELLTRFVGSHGHGRREALETALTQAGGRDDQGFRYEFPEGTAHLKPLFKKWVFTQPQQQVIALAKAGKKEVALQLAKSLLKELQSLKGAMVTADVQDKSRFSDMIAALSGPEQAVTDLVTRLENPNAEHDVLTALDHKKDYERLLQNCKGYRYQFRKSLSRAAEMREDGHLSLRETIENTDLVNQGDELMAQWEKDFANLKVLAEAYDLGGSAREWAHYAPDSGWLTLMKKGNSPLQYDAKRESQEDKAHSEAVDKAKYKDQIAADNKQISDRVHAMNPWNLEAKANQEADVAKVKRRKARQLTYHQWLPQLKAARSAAAQGAGRVNGMNNRGQSSLIKTKASAAWSKAFATFNQGNVAMSLFQSMLTDDMYFPKAMENKAVQIQALFQKALAQFKAGNRLQG